jgi:peptide/nickel transport system substrate-binding protein
MRISRRRLLAGTGAAALPRFAIAQTGTTTAGGDTRPAITVAVAKISNSGVLDPLREQSSNASEHWLGSLQETLIGRNQQGHLERVPMLATAWRRIDDKTVELSLRPDVVMHDGRVMTAEDVAFSFGPDRMFGGGSAALPKDIVAVARRHWPALLRVEIVDKSTVRFVNGTPDVTMEGRLSAGGSEITSKAAWLANGTWQANSSHCVGTGPYRLREFRPDASLTLEAHDQYWGGRPPLKSLRFVEVPEAQSRVDGLLSGEYQFAGDLPADAIAGIEKDRRFEVQGGLVLNHRIITFDEHNPALVDPRARLAMAQAIDGKAIVDALWAGRTLVPAGLQWPFYGEMFIKGWTVPPYDPAAARKLLKDSGYKGEPVAYRVRNNYYTAEIPTAEIVAEFWKAIGLNAQIAVEENWGEVLAKPGRGVRDWSNSAVFDDPVSSIVNQHGPHGGQQLDGEWTNAEMNTLCGVLETGTDHAKRKAAFARMLQICEREDPAYIVLHQNAVFTGKPRALPWRQPPSFFLDFSPRNWTV